MTLTFRLVALIAVVICISNQLLSVAAARELETLPDNVLVIFHAENGDYWFGSNGQGAYRYDGSELVRYTDQDGLCSNHVVSIQEDRHGSIYLDTLEGISQFDGSAFKTLTLSELDSGDDGWVLSGDDLWFRGRWDENGPYRFDGESLYHLKLPRHPLDASSETDSSDRAFSPYGIYTIHRDDQGNLWFGTSNYGACVFDGENVQWILEDELTELDAGPAPGVRSIQTDRDGHFWFSNDLFHRYKFASGDALIEGKDVNYERFESIPESARGDWPPFGMSIAARDNGEVWIATYDAGVWIYDGENVTHVPVRIEGKAVRLFSIYVDRNNKLWLGSHDSGVLVFDGESFRRFAPTNDRR